MDFVKLNATTYLPEGRLIEGYNSLIWTERYDVFGEFEYKSSDVAETLAVLPQGTLVSHLETREIMEVETHEIVDVGEGADAYPEITVRGRSIAAILESRWVEGPYQEQRRLRQLYSAGGALAVLLYNSVDNVSGKDVTRGNPDPDMFGGSSDDYSWNTTDAIPNCYVTIPAAVAFGASRLWWVTEGILWPQFQKILTDANFGIRVMRPVTPNTGNVLSVSIPVASRGELTFTETANLTGVRFEVYAGLNRNSSVQLSQLQGHLDKPQYLFSKKDYKTVAEIMSGVVEVGDVYAAGTAAFTGLNKRVMGFDAGTPEFPPEPEKPADLGRNPTTAQRTAYYDALDQWKVDTAAWKNKKNAIITSFRTSQTAAAQRALRDVRKVSMFSGDMSELAPYKYKTHYDLGDIITLYGDYGKTAQVRVAEYVRTEDENGDRGIPGFVEP